MSQETMGWVIRIGQLLLSLSILIVLHEMGHFVAARIFKTKVEKFFLFFDYKFALIKKKIGDTTYGIGWIPLGGYVKIAGMVDESMDKEQMKQEPKPWEYRSKPAWQRLIIITGGVIVNLVLGFLIYSMVLFVWGAQYVKTESVKNGIMITDSLGYELGLKDGDRIVGAGNEKIDQFNQIVPQFILGQMNTFQIERDGQAMDIHISDDQFRDIIANAKTPFFTYRLPFIVGEVTKGGAKEAGMQEGDQVIAINDTHTLFFDEVRKQLEANKGQQIAVTALRGADTVKMDLKVSEEGLIGVKLSDDIKTLEKLGYLEVERKKYSFFGSFPAGFDLAVSTIVGYAKQFALIFQPSTGAYKQIGGFKSIAGAFPTYWDWEYFWKITALLSLILAFMNILPIPALDGGHMVFILVEMVSGRKPSEKFLEKAQLVGFVILVALMLYANLNDFI